MAAAAEMTPQLQQTLAARLQEFDQIPLERQQQLQALADYVSSNVGEPIRLTFICTHNSRRSHLAQLWAAAAATHFGIPQVSTYSGGTEVTAFNPRAVATLRRAGMLIEVEEISTNPRYRVKFGPDFPGEICYSKVYNDAGNPQSGFGAVMTCNSADETCPIVDGAAARIAITYVDPKISDDTPEETQTYDARSAQIAREMLFVFSRVAARN